MQLKGWYKSKPSSKYEPVLVLKGGKLPQHVLKAMKERLSGSDTETEPGSSTESSSPKDSPSQELTPEIRPHMIGLSSPEGFDGTVLPVPQSSTPITGTVESGLEVPEERAKTGDVENDDKRRDKLGLSYAKLRASLIFPGLDQIHANMVLICQFDF